MRSQSIFIAIVLALLVTLIVAQKASTDTVTIDCLNGDTYQMIPSQGALGFCGASNNIPCQDAIKMGYPNAFGSVSGVESSGPFVYQQQLTTTPLYIVISDSTGRPAYKTRFFPQVDRYSLLELGGSAGLEEIDVGLFADNAAIDLSSAIAMNSTLIQAEFGGFTTPAVRRAIVPEPTSSDVEPVTNLQRRVVSFYTLIIELDRGMVKSMFWQKGCYGCGDDANCWKEEQWCTNPYKSCSVVDTSATDGLSCNIKIYLAWQGTDSKGNYLMSGQATIKNFLQFDVRTPFESAQNVFGSLGPGNGEV
jgi:hypothetical protein